MIEHSVAVTTLGSQSRRSQLNPMGSQFLIPVLWNLCSEPVGDIKLWDPVKDSDTGGPSSIIVMME